jgi:hypothetical protein
VASPFRFGFDGRTDGRSSAEQTELTVAALGRIFKGAPRHSRCLYGKKSDGGLERNLQPLKRVEQGVIVTHIPSSARFLTLKIRLTLGSRGWMATMRSALSLRLLI